MPNLARMENHNSVIIIGGGLAGLACGIHLSKKHVPVTIIEKSSYPGHKVCGEYVSNEIIPYLKWLGVDMESIKPAAITRFEFSGASGKTLKANLPVGGTGISRYALDDMLYRRALETGCKVLRDTVIRVSFDENEFTVNTASASHKATLVFGAYGKRSVIDIALSRPFIKKKAPWLAVKGHYTGNFPDDLVALHNFKGGYCGVSKVEDDIINICYLADYETFRKYKDVYAYQKNVVSGNPHLAALFSAVQPVFEKPLAISQISFEEKAAVEDHILMIGDTAGLIHPLCGNGMAMAIHSAKIGAELGFSFLTGNISRLKLEDLYKRAWKSHFGKRIFTGRLLGRLLRRQRLSAMMMGILSAFPALLPLLIKQTHGKLVTMAN